jgi:hypothetical protein
LIFAIAVQMMRKQDAYCSPQNFVELKTRESYNRETYATIYSNIRKNNNRRNKLIIVSVCVLLGAAIALLIGSILSLTVIIR